MLSINDRQKLIKYLNENKNKLKDIFQDFKLAKNKEKEKFKLDEILTKERLDEIFDILILFIRFIKSISESFEEE